MRHLWGSAVGTGRPGRDLAGNIRNLVRFCRFASVTIEWDAGAEPEFASCSTVGYGVIAFDIIEVGMATIEERLHALESENIEIKRRLATVEGQFEFISRQLRESHVYMHAKFAEIDERFDAVDRRFDAVDKRFDRIEADLKGLRTDLPGMMRDVMREVLAEQRKA